MVWPLLCCAPASFFICNMKYLVCAAALAASLATAQAGGAVELSKDNFDAEIAGKNGFIKFLAPVSSIPLPGFARGINSPRVRLQCRFIGFIACLDFVFASTLVVSFSHDSGFIFCSGNLSGEDTANP